MSFIYLVGYSIEKRLLLACAKRIKEAYGFEVRTSHMADNPFGAGKLYHVVSLLKRVYFQDMVRLVSVVNLALWEEDMGTVESFSEVGGKLVVVSIAGEQSFEYVTRRVVEALEHSFGSLLCSKADCHMAKAKDKVYFCPKCSRILAKP